MRLKRIGKALLFPPIAVVAVLTPVAAAGLIYAMLRHRAGEQMRQELARYRAWVFPLTNLALSAMMFYMISQNRAVRHNEITTIAMSIYMIVQANRKCKYLEASQWKTTTASE